MRWLLVFLLIGPVVADPYKESIEVWHQDRVERLTRPDGWLSLVGLHWLDQSENRVDGLGRMMLKGETVEVQHQGETATVDLNEKEGTTVFRQGSLSWYFIRRNGRVGIRVKDSQSPVLLEFKGLKRFPVDRHWRFTAKLRPDQKAVTVGNVQGWSEQETSPGCAVFEYQSQEYALKLIGQPEDRHYFLVFRDQTNGHQSYSGGRFLYLAKNDDGTLDLDFNRAYNPPCSFTEYATCPMPPLENQLPFSVTAGEKAYHAR